MLLPDSFAPILMISLVFSSINFAKFSNISILLSIGYFLHLFEYSFKLLIAPSTILISAKNFCPIIFPVWGDMMSFILSDFKSLPSIIENAEICFLNIVEFNFSIVFSSLRSKPLELILSV